MRSTCRLEDENVMSTSQKIIGATNPVESALGTICGDFDIDIGRKIIFHGSEAVESSRKEMELWFLIRVF
ncbi:putative nucleoside-diphosphate kinase [Rosa chinensis]|uniref:nucleoside-diphosphate kinase n=1 Tax=Rosa chinensis TaxID=74649 RepID=A0A2P6RTK2_ROSCH|nr:putative nucleoside-diphosphate kinase [Rosa chinensis]